MSAAHQLTSLLGNHFSDRRTLLLLLTTLLWLICTQHNLCNFHFSPSVSSASGHCAASPDETEHPSTDPIQDCHDTPCLAVVSADDQIFERLNAPTLTQALASLDMLPWLWGWVVVLAVRLPRAPPPCRRSPKQTILYGFCILRN